MKWISETPCSIVSAWNNLCEALWERQSFYGIYGLDYSEAALLPEIPCTRKMGIDTMRYAIRDLLNNSFDFRKFGVWTGNEAAKFVLNEQFFADFGTDIHSFWGTGADIPGRRHTQSDFIRSAACLLNNAVRYPLPFWSEPASRKGFALQCDFYGEPADGGTISGNWLDDGGLRYGDMLINLRTLAIWHKKSGRGRSYGHHWVYLPGSKDSGRPGRVMPPLRGIGKIRADFTVSSTAESEIVDCGTQEFDIDFSLNRATGMVDFSQAENFISGVWNTKSNWRNQLTAAAAWQKVEVLLKEENFPELPYKYLE